MEQRSLAPFVGVGFEGATLYLFLFFNSALPLQPALFELQPEL